MDDGMQVLRDARQYAKRRPVPIERCGLLPRYRVGGPGGPTIWLLSRAKWEASNVLLRREGEYLERWIDGRAKR